MSIFLLYLTAAATLRSPATGLLLAYLLVATFTALVLLARPELGLLAEVTPAVSLWALALGLVGRIFLDGLSVPSLAAGWGSFAFAAGFALRFGGMVYPQFLTSDIILHVHNLQSVLHGQWLFTEPLPDGTPVPYPNAFYVLLSPFAGLLGASDASLSMLLKWSGALIDSATCLALAWAGARLWGSMSGAFAALIYAMSPAAFELLSAGNYTNLFAQTALNITLLIALVYLAGRSRLLAGVLGPLLLAVGFVLTMLGHYGMMLAALALTGFFVVWAIWLSYRGARDARKAWMVVSAAATGLVFSFAAYYWHFTSEMWTQWTGLYQRLVGAKPGVQGTGSASAGSGVADFVARRSVLVSPLLAITAASSSLLGLRARERTAPTAPAYAGLLGAWVAAALLFGALDRVVGDTVRWAYLGAGAVALLAGRFLAVLLPVGNAARLLIGLVLAAVLWYTLLYWVGDLVFTHYH